MLYVQLIAELGLDKDKVRITILSLRNGSIVVEMLIETFGDTPEEAASSNQKVNDADFTSLTVMGQSFDVEPLEIIPGKTASEGVWKNNTNLHYRAQLRY